MAVENFNIHRVTSLPSTGTNGDWYILKKGTDRNEIYIAQPNGTLTFNKGITDAEQSRLINDYTNTQIDQKVQQTVAETIPLSDTTPTVLKRGSDIPSYITNIGKTDLYGGTSGTTYTNTGRPSPNNQFVIAAGQFATAFYTKSTDTWSLGTPVSLPAAPVTGIVAEGNTNATSGDTVFKSTLKPSDLKTINLSNQIFNKNDFRDNTSILSNGVLSNPIGAQTTLDLPIPRDNNGNLVYTSIAISGLYAGNNHRIRFLKSDGTIITPLSNQFLASRIEPIPIDAYYYTIMFRNNGEPETSIPKDTFMLNWGNTILPYETYKNNILSIQNKDIIASSVLSKTGEIISVDSFELKKGSIKVYLSTTLDKWYIRVSFSDTYDLVHVWSLDVLNGQPEMINVLKILKTVVNSEDIFSNTQIIKSGSDDICPIRFDTNYLLSGGHGVTVRNVALNGHGKTSSDLLSIWSDGTRQWRLVTIIDSNNLRFIPLPAATANGTWVYTSFASNTLTHVSGAVNISNINVTTSTTEEMKSLKPGAVWKLYLDGKEINQSGLYLGEEFKIYDEHVIVDVRNLTSQIPFQSNSGTDLVTERITYKIDKYNNTYADYIFEGKTTSYIEEHGFMQFQRAITSFESANNTMLYIPDSGSINNGTSTFNLATTPVNIFNPLGGNSLIYTPSNIPDSNKPIFRVIELQQTSSGVKKQGFAHGYSIDLGITKNTNRKNNSKLWEIRGNSGKSYPVGINNMQITNNTVIQSKIIRSIYNAELNPELTSVYHYKESDKIIVYIDAHKTLSKQVVNLHKDLSGKKIIIKQTGGNMQLLTTDYVSENGQVLINCDNYGYLILELT